MMPFVTVYDIFGSRSRTVVQERRREALMTSDGWGVVHTLHANQSF